MEKVEVTKEIEKLARSYTSKISFLYHEERESLVPRFARAIAEERERCARIAYDEATFRMQNEFDFPESRIIDFCLTANRIRREIINPTRNADAIVSEYIDSQPNPQDLWWMERDAFEGWK